MVFWLCSHDDAGIEMSLRFVCELDRWTGFDSTMSFYSGLPSFNMVWEIF